MKPDVSIIVPAYDEQDRLGDSVGKILAYFTDCGIAAELIVVDDGSIDCTAAIAEQVCAEFDGAETTIIRYETNRGKGFAVKTGLLAASADVALFTDADISTPIDEIPKLIDPIMTGEFDVTFGSRALDRSLIGSHQPWSREQGGKVFNLIVRLMTGMPFWDTQCGFKAFNLIKFRPLLSMMKIDRFGFDVEFLYVAQLHRLRLAEIPIRWDNDERSKVSVLRDSIRMFDEVRQIRRNAAKGSYQIGQQNHVIEFEPVKNYAGDEAF
jgi:dolichyl-phosphate beta-glucosyltransferase